MKAEACILTAQLGVRGKAVEDEGSQTVDRRAGLCSFVRMLRRPRTLSTRKNAVAQFRAQSRLPQESCWTKIVSWRTYWALRRLHGHRVLLNDSLSQQRAPFVVCRVSRRGPVASTIEPGCSLKNLGPLLAGPTHPLPRRPSR